MQLIDNAEKLLCLRDDCMRAAYISPCQRHPSRNTQPCRAQDKTDLEAPNCLFLHPLEDMKRKSQGGELKSLLSFQLPLLQQG